MPHTATPGGSLDAPEPTVTLYGSLSGCNGTITLCKYLFFQKERGFGKRFYGGHGTVVILPWLSLQTASKIANIAYSSFKKLYSHIITSNAITTGYYAKLSLSIQIIR